MNDEKSHPHRIQEFSFGMDLKLTAEIYRDGEWYVGFCPEVPEANGQGKTPEECVQSLKEAILLLMQDRREDAARKLPKGRHILKPA
jgi:predicted RNase H-like HicB family nuclease